MMAVDADKQSGPLTTLHGNYTATLAAVDRLQLSPQDTTTPFLTCFFKVECCLYRHSVQLDLYLRKNMSSLVSSTTITDFADQPLLANNVQFVNVCEPVHSTSSIHDLSSTRLSIHVYQLNPESGVEEKDEEDNVTSNHWVLPAESLNGLWQNLIFDDNIPTQLLNYVYTTMLFSDKEVDSNVIAWNRVILLHGPPGTGKTSLCRALAQKLAIRLSDRYLSGKLVEINSHSLFSKYFSESGKLVMKMFQHIHELIEDEESFVCVLIDEVESLTAARKSALSGSEPSDAVRVVNAILTQIDQIRQHKNVLILTTSNITEAIDLAFVDRADIKQYIGLPSPRAIYSILSSCLKELMRVEIIAPSETLVDHRTIELYLHLPLDQTTSTEIKNSVLLFQVATKCHGLSGRTLRKLPFLTHAMYYQTSAASLSDYIQALGMAVENEQTVRQELSRTSP
ncbi:pachytene checkpoint protein 2 [Paraphysoderma sedebokerense]|nr:pachytene checkpoint protein 2 [Paraphysoderma sedebokerense]